MLTLFAPQEAEELATRRQRRVTIVVRRRGKRPRISTPLEEWERKPEPMEAMTEHDLAQALAEDEELLVGLWD